MVLATRLISLSSLVLALLSSGCQAELNNITDEATLDAHHIKLSNEGSGCALINSDGKTIHKTELMMQPPCYFVRKDGPQLQQFSYPDKGLKAVVLIIGNPISDEKRKKWNLDESFVCGEKRQAVYLSKSGLTTSSITMDGGLACKDTGIDEKDFAYFAMQFTEKNN